MRILPLIISALLIAAQPVQAAVCVGFGQSAANCMNGTYTFSWDGDWSGDADKACSTSGDSTGIDGTLTGTTISTDYGESGSYGMIIDGTNDYIKYSTSSDINIDPSVATTIWMRIYLSAAPGQGINIFKVCGTTDCSTNDYITIAITNTREMMCTYRNSTISPSNYSASTIAIGSWVDIAYSFDPANQDHDVTHNGTNWSEDINEITTVSTWNA